MPSWPVGLPNDLFTSLQVKAQDAVLRTSMDAGPPTTRNRFTAVYKNLTGQMNLTGAQVSTLETFYATTLSNGALSFNWTDPRSDASVTMKFAEPPGYSGLTGSDVANDRLWSVSLSLHILP